MLKYCKTVPLLRRPFSALLAALMLSSLRAPLCNAQDTHIFLSLRDGTNLNTFETEHYIFEGDGVTMRCVCPMGSETEITYLSWIHNGQEIHSQSSCDPPLSHTVPDARTADSGEYVCKATFSYGNFSSSRVQIRVVGSDAIVAPPKQYGLVNTSVSLNCSTTFSETNSIATSWYRDEAATQSTSGVFNPVHLSDDGMYVCRLFISSLNRHTIKMINFTVIVPPIIIQKPESKLLSGNQAATFPVRFQSRLPEDTVVVWFKNENTAVRGDLIHTVFEEQPFASTEIRFASLRRSDSGRYRVAIRNNFEGLPQELSEAEASFELTVTVMPVAPSNVMVEHIGPMSATVGWTLPTQSLDDRPDNITSQLYYSNGTLAAQHTLDGTETSLQLSLIPGMQYSLRLRAANVDGMRESDPVEFQSANGAPHPPQLSVERVSSNSFNLTVSFFYTGGGDITKLKVYYKRLNSEEDWTLLGTVNAEPTENYLQWKATVSSQALSTLGLQFQVEAMNSNEYYSAPVVMPEPIELPGPPKPPVVSSTHNSVILQVELSPLGASPITSVVVDFINHSDVEPYVSYDNYQPGQLVLLTVGGLQARTSYTLTVSAVNHGGKGEPSLLVEVQTGAAPPLPLYAIVLVSIFVALIIIIVVVIAMVVCRRVYNIQQAKKRYKISSESKTGTLKSQGLSSGEQELVSGTKRPPVPRYTTPSLSSGSDSGRSQSMYSRQGSTCTYPISPQRTISTSDGGSPIDSFTFQRHNSVATSNDSESEANYPRYTYKVSPEPPVLSTPTLTTHSLHSMQLYPSTMTRLTGSTGSSNSTRESLIVSPAEFNATNV